MRVFRALTSSCFAIAAAIAAQAAPLEPPCDGPYTPAYTIQGGGSSAAITGRVATQGVVVGDFEGERELRGFDLQDASGDSDPATSDGIFVFTGSADTVGAGQLVRVTGYARERFGQTTLNGSDSDSSAVPPVDIVSCGAGSVTATDVTLPFASVDGPERYEGMLVRLPQALVISEYFDYGRFGELMLALPLPGESRVFAPTSIVEPGAPALARALADSASRITLDDALSAQNPISLRHPNGATFSLDNRFPGGDEVQNTVGVLGYDFGLYRIAPTGPADYAVVNARLAAPETIGGDVRVAAMNTRNFFLTLDHPRGHPLDDRCGPRQLLWPPNHKYVNVEATVVANDDSDPGPTLTLLSVTRRADAGGRRLPGCRVPLRAGPCRGTRSTRPSHQGGGSNTSRRAGLLAWLPSSSTPLAAGRVTNTGGRLGRSTPSREIRSGSARGGRIRRIAAVQDKSHGEAVGRCAGPLGRRRGAARARRCGARSAAWARKFAISPTGTCAK